METRASTIHRPPPIARVARALASPTGVLFTLPLLVMAVGAAILLVGREATHDATASMARHQLSEQAISVQADVAFALDQAGPLLARLDTVSDPARATDDVLLRLHDLMIGRPGVAFVSLSFPDGKFRGAYLGDHGRVEVQESTLGAHGTDVHRFTIKGAALVPLRDDVTDYDPRKRGFYTLATTAGARVWTAPYTFFVTHETGITCAEPVYDADHHVRAVLTVDFDINALSDYVARPALDQGRSVVFTGDRTILALPADAKVAIAVGKDQLVRAADLRDAALEGLFAALPASGALAGPATTTGDVRYLDLSTRDGEYLASVAPLGGKRAGVTVPLDWYVATVVPERTLIGPTRAFERRSGIASVIALAVAVGLALVLAWNLVRMRRAVATSRAQARTAEARARELGSYRLVAKLGTGGMGEVWRAEHRLLARQAAIKLIRPEVLHDPAAVDEIRERFRREAQTLASMKSRHTIEIFDYGVTGDDVFYYVMELLDGLDLESLVARYGPQPAPRVIAMMIQACASLAEAHDAGLLHRDIKPPNLFTCRAADEVDIIKLLDFGIVQAVNEVPVAPTGPFIPQGTGSGPRLTQTGAILGTPGFMPPEQILGLPLDGRADLYALGCVAWWLLTGGELFDREAGEATLMRQHMYEAPPPLADRVDGWFPPELETVLRACLAKDLEERPTDARVLADLLRAIPLPADRVWTQAKAVGWWTAYQGATVTPVRPSEVQMIMPAETKRSHPG